MVRGKEKSNASLRRDPSWKYSVQVDIGGAEKTYVYLKCNFCDKVVKGGVTRMKEHLSGSHKNVAPCANVPDKVKEEICAYMKKSITAKHLQQEQFDDRVEHGSYYGSESGKGSSSTIHSRGARGPMDQYMVNPGEDRGQTQMMPAAGTREGRRQVCLDIGRFFFENAIPFNVATSPAYFNMLRSVGLYGRWLKAPSMYELRTWILKEELHNTEQSIEEIKRTLSETGVTIMSDGWSDMKSRSLINILVNNPYGTVFLRSVEASDEVKNADFLFNLLDGVVEEIGEQLVVQVVTDNASAYKAAGHMLMEKRKHLYWTPCAAHCIDLILEQLGDLPQHKNALSKAKKITMFIYNHSWVLSLMRKFSKKEIIRPATTRFATSYLTLQSILDVRQPLEAKFTSTQWLNSAWGKKPEGKEVRTMRRNRLSTLRMNSLVYIMHNKRLRDRRLRNKGLKDDEDPLVCEDVASDNEWFIDDETDLPLSDLQLEDLSVDVLRGEADQGGVSTSATPHTSTSSAAKGKRKVGIIEDDEDLNFIDTIGEEDSLEDPFSDGT
ncbi:hypothetical protein M5K25_000921 [Dendrobium thyrsiflorum]|uniref:BED-type domain-containing protein n=1 Tax=Dendrobium thyrsiflorum TaxID=117978 RepID=A0ABD0VUR7_DENTH